MEVRKDMRSMLKYKATSLQDIAQACLRMEKEYRTKSLTVATTIQKSYLLGVAEGYRQAAEILNETQLIPTESSNKT